MIAHWTDKLRFLAVMTPLGAEKLLLRSFTGHEGISQLFHFQLDMLSEEPAINFNDLIGQNITFSVKLADTSKERYFNGYVSRFTQLPSEERLTHYQAEVVPWLWFLTRTQDCRIFQNKSVVDIVKQVFDDFGFKDYDDQTQGNYDAVEYCVQYHETAFNFVMRLLEENGIFFFFRHENGKHTLVLADVQSAHQNCPEFYQVFFERTGGAGVQREEDVILTWRVDQEMRTGGYAVNDYNFETPNTRLDASAASTISQGGNTRFELYEYPGRYKKRSEGDKLAKVRMEEEEAAHTVVSGESDCRTFVSGFKFELQGYERRDQNQAYILTSITHSADSGSFYSGAGSESGATYNNSFTAIPAAVKFRPPRITPRPLVYGSQTAVVVGPSGEEIYVDKYGRVKVQFFWDRRGQNNENSSCWVRVSQAIAGKGWGSMWIPRIGQEVIVDFLEGDPDHPIITGRVYNAGQMPPYTLPDEQTKSSIKSYSSKGGGGFNEIRFEDKKGSEQVFLHGEKNLDIRIKADKMQNIGGEVHLTVDKDQMELVKGDAHLEVKGDQNEKVAGTYSLKTGQDMQLKCGNNYAMDAGTEAHIKSGMSLVLETGTSLTLKVGGNFITINSAGVNIQGTLVNINSGGAAGSGSGCSPNPPKAPKDADTAIPGQASEPPPNPQPPKPQTYGPAAQVLKSAAQSGAPFCDI